MIVTTVTMIVVDELHAELIVMRCSDVYDFREILKILSALLFGNETRMS